MSDVTFVSSERSNHHSTGQHHPDDICSVILGKVLAEPANVQLTALSASSHHLCGFTLTTAPRPRLWIAGSHLLSDEDHPELGFILYKSLHTHTHTHLAQYIRKVSHLWFLLMFSGKACSNSDVSHLNHRQRDLMVFFVNFVYFQTQKCH